MGGSFLWRREEKNNFRSVGTKSARLVQPQNTAVRCLLRRERKRKKERKKDRAVVGPFFRALHGQRQKEREREREKKGVCRKRGG